jgi:acetylornithine deacetylase
VKVRSGDGVGLLRELVRIDSRNPSLVPDGPGEGRVARALADVLASWGIDAELQEVVPGRPNVVATVQGKNRSARSLMFNGHIDTVGVEGMTHPPFAAETRGGAIYGRGSSDMKGGVAAMCAAAARLKGSLPGNLVIAGVIDEEWQSLGTQYLLDVGVRADAAVVTEPTHLSIMPAHKGFAWIEVTMHGRAAHGSRWDLGVDAIRNMGALLVELERIDSEVLPHRTHELLGRASVHASTIEGGVGLSTYPDRCVLRIERRTIPGEHGDGAHQEIRDVCDRLQKERPDFRADVRLLFKQPPSDVATDAPIVTALVAAAKQHGVSPQLSGMSAWTDAALLNEARIPAICFGPGDMGLAHAAEEYIQIEEIERATEILVALAREWCS